MFFDFIVRTLYTNVKKMVIVGFLLKKVGGSTVINAMKLVLKPKVSQYE